MSRSTLVLVVLFALVTIPAVFSLKHNLVIENDGRRRFYIENFGFEKGGNLFMNITDFRVNGEPYVVSNPDEPDEGFIIKRTEVDSAAFLEENADVPCLLVDQYLQEEDLMVPITNADSTTFHIVVTEGYEGFYNTYFVNCKEAEVSFNLELIQYNVDSDGDKSYLSVGYAPRPTVYACLTFAYLITLAIWLFTFLRGPDKRINKVHHLMTVLLVLKICALFFKAIEYHYIKVEGSANGWNVAYYIFAGLKGIMMFVLIAIIGSGWYFVKPFLTDKDKKIFLIVIPLQVLDNIALIIIEETAPGSQGWLSWKDIFRLVDIICCGAILIPIIWSIKHLREASQIDGKAARNVKKLKLFRHFYLMVVTYIYFTRIIIYLFDATLPFRFVWIGDLCAELATLIFFCITGYKFRPAEDNPYFSLEGSLSDEDEMEEIVDSPSEMKRNTED